MRRKDRIATIRRKEWVKYLIFPVTLILVTLGTYLFWSKNEELLMSNSPSKKIEEKVDKEKVTTEINKNDEKDIVKNGNKDKDVNKPKDYQYDARLIQDRLTNYNYANNGDKMVFLTFDDGTSTTVTPQILDVLDKENVKATFFVAGSMIESGEQGAKELLKREYKSGHSIGNHSYTHNYSNLYPNGSLNLNNFVNDYNKNDEVLKTILGQDFTSRVWRCPGGYMSWEDMGQLTQYAKDNNKAYIDWNALTEDAQGAPKTEDQLYENAVKYSEGKDVVVLLMHDNYGKELSAKALPRIIEYYRNNGYKFMTLV